MHISIYLFFFSYTENTRFLLLFFLIFQFVFRRLYILLQKIWFYGRSENRLSILFFLHACDLIDLIWWTHLPILFIHASYVSKFVLHDCDLLILWFIHCKSFNLYGMSGSNEYIFKFSWDFIIFYLCFVFVSICTLRTSL